MYVFIEFIDICSTSLLYGIHSFSWKRSTQFQTESMDPSPTPNWIYIMYPTHILSSMSQTFTFVFRLSYIHLCDISWYFVCSPKTNKHITDFPWPPMTSRLTSFVWLRSSDCEAPCRQRAPALGPEPPREEYHHLRGIGNHWTVIWEPEKKTRWFKWS